MKRRERAQQRPWYGGCDEAPDRSRRWPRSKATSIGTMTVYSLFVFVVVLAQQPRPTHAVPHKFVCTDTEVYDQYSTSKPEILNGNCFNLRGENLNDATAACSSSTERCWRRFRCDYIACSATRLQDCVAEASIKNYPDGICWQNYVAMDHTYWNDFANRGPRALKRNFASDVAAVALDTERGPAVVVVGGKKSYTTLMEEQRQTEGTKKCSSPNSDSYCAMIPAQYSNLIALLHIPDKRQLSGTFNDNRRAIWNRKDRWGCQAEPVLSLLSPSLYPLSLSLSLSPSLSPTSPSRPKLTAERIR